MTDVDVRPCLPLGTSIPPLQHMQNAWAEPKGKPHPVNHVHTWAGRQCVFLFCTDFHFLCIYSDSQDSKLPLEGMELGICCFRQPIKM